jgi:hypothetical protein
LIDRNFCVTFVSVFRAGRIFAVFVIALRTFSWLRRFFSTINIDVIGNKRIIIAVSARIGHRQTRRSASASFVGSGQRRLE